MKVSKLIRFFAALLCVFMLSSCTEFDSNAKSLLLAPRQEELYHIQKALEKSAGSDITLKYPTSGEYRSAFILKDVNNDGQEEAFAFYSKTVEDAVTMNINVISSNGEEWQSRGNSNIVAGGIEKVVFCDLDGDSVEEIVVGWTVFGSVDKQLAVYSFDGQSIKKRAGEKYSDFICGNLTGDNKNELIVLGINATDKSATAKVFSLQTGSVSELGAVQLDGGITSFYTPVLSKLSNSRPAVYVDAVKGVGLVTEILWFEKESLMHLIRSNGAEESETFRTTLATVKDFNADGILDVPLSEILKSTAKSEEIYKVYVTNWSNFDGSSFETIASAFMNYSDGYYLTISPQMLDKLYLARKTDSRLRIFYSFDLNTQTQGDEVFRIMAVDKSIYNEETYKSQSYENIYETDKFVYLIRVQKDNPIGMTKEILKTNFGVLK